MTRIAELLDRIKEQQGIASNYALAKLLQIEEKRIGDYYRGMVKPDDYAITRVALMLQMEPIHLLAEIRATDEKNATKREFWSNFLRRAAVVFGFLVVQALGFPSTSEADASTASYGRYDGRFTESQIMRLCRRWLAHLLSLFHAPVFGASPA